MTHQGTSECILTVVLEDKGFVYVALIGERLSHIDIE